MKVTSVLKITGSVDLRKNGLKNFDNFWRNEGHSPKWMRSINLDISMSFLERRDLVRL
jgi:hypothetical protein